MSGYWPKDGDRVRVVLEGVARPDNDVDANFTLNCGIRGYYINPSEDYVVSVERVTPPLPTTPGSVVRQDGCYLVLSTSGRWGCPDHGGWNYPAPGSQAYDVLFDAGGAS